MSPYQFPKDHTKYTLTGDELKKISCSSPLRLMTRSELIQRTVAGFMDIINIDKTGENFGLIYDTKVYFVVHHIAPEERPSTSCTTLTLCKVTGGANLGRIDANGSSFVTQLSNIFVIGKGNKPWISLPQGKCIHLIIAKERDKRLMAKQSL
eukprot:bmy_22368T0